MNHAARPTYSLAPEWIYPPDGPIQLGNILTNPHDPQSVLIRIPPNDEALLTSTSLLRDWHAEADSIYKVQVGVWAQIAVYASAMIRAGRHRKDYVHFTMTELETRIIQHRPTPKTMARWVATVPDLREIVCNLQRTPLTLQRQKLYFVSGIKIARNFQVMRTSSRAHAVELAADVPIPVPVGVSAGANVALDERRRHSEGFRAGNDVVFAYELLEIRVQGRDVCETFKIAVRRSQAYKKSRRQASQLEAIIVDITAADEVRVSQMGKKDGRRGTGKEIVVREDLDHEDIVVEDMVNADVIIEDVLGEDPDNEDMMIDDILGDDPDNGIGDDDIEADRLSVALSLSIEMSVDANPGASGLAADPDAVP